MCATSKFPEAYPVRNIRGKSVIHHLTKFCSLFGLPRVIQTDNGSNFRSAEFKRFFEKYQIEHRLSSTYHPHSQGALERFHQTMKQKLRAVIEDSRRNWDEDLPFILFAARNGLQHSLGCSPLQLVFGHQVRGLIQLLSERYLGNVSLRDGSRLLSEVQSKLKKYQDVASDHLKKSQLKMKQHHDKKFRVKLRCFQPGDFVLVLKSRVETALAHHFEGPFEVVCRRSELTYNIKSAGRYQGLDSAH
nr:uncharacterized protein K02A2.6-like [Procambarus clarkii]